jgi:hypothetical protein
MLLYKPGKVSSTGNASVMNELNQPFRDFSPSFHVNIWTAYSNVIQPASLTEQARIVVTL